MQKFDDPMRTELEHAWTTYGVAQCYPGEGERFLRMLNMLVDDIAHEILSHCLRPKHPLGLPHTTALQVAEPPTADYHPEK